jgi:hypothetical protein
MDINKQILSSVKLLILKIQYNNKNIKYNKYYIKYHIKLLSILYVHNNIIKSLLNLQHTSIFIKIVGRSYS